MTDDTMTMRVLLGSTERRGTWNVPDRVTAHVTLGHIQLDLRDANLGAHTTVDAQLLLGNLEILVPHDVVVDVDVRSFAANVGARGTARDGGRRLRVIGNVRFGSCEVIACERGPT